MKKVDAIQSVEDLLQLVLLHRDRFVDTNGNPIPIVQELSRYVEAKQGKIHASQTAAKPAHAATPASAPGKVDRSKLEIGDHYVAEADDVSGDKGKYVVRTVRKDGNDGYVSVIGHLGFGGIKKFNTREEAQKWIDANPAKNKKQQTINPKERIAEIDGMIREYQKDLQLTQKNLEAWKQQGKEKQVNDSQKTIKKFESIIGELEKEKAHLQSNLKTQGKNQFFIKNKAGSYKSKSGGWGWAASEQDGFVTQEEAQAAADQWNER
jgi:hypothetical protein